MNATQVEHVEADGLHCPYCSTGKVYTLSLNLHDPVTLLRVRRCQVCGNDWKDVFTLTGYIIES